MYSSARRRASIATIVACAAIAVYLLYPIAIHSIAQKIRESQGVQVAKKAPDFTLKDVAGKRLSLSDYKGKVVLLNFWATWCGPCKVEIPWFIEFESQYQAQGFTVLGVSMDEDGWKAITPYVAGHHMNYPVVLGDEEVNERYGGIDALPTTLLIARDGKVRAIHQGLPPQGRAEYEKEIRELLGVGSQSAKRRVKLDSGVVRHKFDDSAAPLNCLDASLRFSFWRRPCV